MVSLRSALVRAVNANRAHLKAIWRSSTGTLHQNASLLR